MADIIVLAALEENTASMKANHLEIKELLIKMLELQEE